jgi:hypothetical protein
MLSATHAQAVKERSALLQQLEQQEKQQLEQGKQQQGE